MVVKEIDKGIHKDDIEISKAISRCLNRWESCRIHVIRKMIDEFSVHVISTPYRQDPILLKR